MTNFQSRLLKLTIGQSRRLGPGSRGLTARRRLSDWPRCRRQSVTSLNAPFAVTHQPALAACRMVQGVEIEDGHIVDRNPATGEVIARV